MMPVAEIVLSCELVHNCIGVSQTVKHNTNNAKAVGSNPRECIYQSNVYLEWSVALLINVININE